MTKTLQQIKDEYAIEEHCLESFHQLIRVDEITDRDVDQIAIRYAQDQKRELVEELEHVVKALEVVSSFGATKPIIEHAKEIITKHKQS